MGTSVSPPRNIKALTPLITGDPTRDEIDVELLGGDPNHWQTNIFGPSEQDLDPHYGKFNKIYKFPESDTIGTMHSYTIDWSSERIIWSVDGRVERRLYRSTIQHSHLLASAFADLSHVQEIR